MKNAMGIILTGGRNNRLKELSNIRSSSAIPVGGKYRAIDFVLSNMVNSSITKIGVLTQYSFRSLIDHLGSGKEWDLDRRNDGLYVFPPFLSDEDSGWYKGTADAMYNNITFLKRSFEEYVIVAQGNCVYKMIFDDMLKYHIKSNSDITIAYRDMQDFSNDELVYLGNMKVDDDGKLIEMQEKPLHPKYTTCSMGIYILKRELLISLLEECISQGYYDFVKDVLIKKIGVLNIYGYKFNGYWRNLSTISGYYRCNMEMLNAKIRHQLFVKDGKIYTKVKDEPPTKYNFEADVKNSIIADGCIVEGTVENSILFRGATIKKGAVVKDSIVMQDSILGENSSVQYIILDKDVEISANNHLNGTLSLPIIIGKGTKI